MCAGCNADCATCGDASRVYLFRCDAKGERTCSCMRVYTPYLQWMIIECDRRLTIKGINPSIKGTGARVRIPFDEAQKVNQAFKVEPRIGITVNGDAATCGVCGCHLTGKRVQSIACAFNRH